jgi:hypothetical protein
MRVDRVRPRWIELYRLNAENTARAGATAISIASEDAARRGHQGPVDNSRKISGPISCRLPLYVDEGNYEK